MARSGIHTLLFCSIFLAGISNAFSQKKTETITSKWAGAAIVADGLLQDWTDTPARYSEAAKIYYEIANDDKNLYLAIKSSGRESLSKILMSGITFSANTELNKKNPPRIVFPILDRTPGKPGARREQPTVEEIQQETISKIRDIRVFGFDHIVDGPVSLQNTYGIRAAAAFENQNTLVQEIIIPLSLLKLDPSSTDQFTCVIRINGINTPSSQRSVDPRRSMGMYGMYGGYGQYPVPQVNKALAPVELSIKTRLSQKPL